MKEEIYTIPVMDGFQSGTECPFCSMYRKLETDSIQFVLSPSYMEEDVRGETNEKGFCRLHMKQLYDRGNSLGLALMLHSHMNHRIQVLGGVLEQNGERKPQKGWFSKKTETAGNPLDELRRQWNDSCYICDRIRTVFARFTDTFFYLWKKQAGFREIAEAAPGYCVDHFLMLYTQADQYLKEGDCQEFREKLRAQELNSLSRVADDLEWFTLKFDYRYQDKPWKNSKDALPRAILKMNSQFVEKEKNS